MSGILGGIAGNLAGGNIGRAVVSLVLDTTGYNAQLEKTKVETSAATDSMSAGASKFGAAALAGIAVAGVAFADFAKNSVSAAIDAQQQQDKLANSIQNSATVSTSAIPAFQAQAQAIRDLTGVDDDAINGMQAFLIQMHLNQGQVTQLTPLIVDLSQKMGISLDAAAKAVGKSVNGTSGGLQRMGVVVDKTAFATDHYGATLKALGVVQGFAAQKADAQPWLLLQSTFQEFEEQVGRELLPTLTDLAQTALPLLQTGLQGLIPVIDATSQSAKGLSDILGLLHGQIPTISFDSISSSLQTATRWFDGLALGTDQATQAQIQAREAQLQTAQATDGTTNSIKSSYSALAEQARAEHEAAAAAKAHTQAMQAERQAEEQLSGGLISLIADQESLNAARQKQQQLLAAGKQGTLDYHDAVAQVLTAQQQLNLDLQDQAVKMRQSGVSASTLIDRIIGIGKAAGLSKQDVQAWATQLKGAGDLIDTLNQKTLQPKVDTSGITALDSKLRDLQYRMNRFG